MRQPKKAKAWGIPVTTMLFNFLCDSPAKVGQPRSVDFEGCIPPRWMVHEWYLSGALHWKRSGCKQLGRVMYAELEGVFKELGLPLRAPGDRTGVPARYKGCRG